MSTLTEKLINILERDRRGAKDPDAEKPDVSIPLPPSDYYVVGTVFYSKVGGGGILARIGPQQCMLICLPGGNRYSDENTFQLDLGEQGIKKEVFHEAFNDSWEVSRRGKEALEEWARTDV